jgi:hypothetical protein
MKEEDNSQRDFFPRKGIKACGKKHLEKGFSIEGAPGWLECKREVLQDEPADRGVRGGNPCPVCNNPSEDLTWIYFASPRWSWKKLCRRAGWLTVYDDCHVQVQFFCDVMN